MAHGWIWGFFGIVMVGAWLRFGWQGALLVFSVGVFVVLLQFSRAMRALQVAGRSPIGQVGSAVMLNAQLRQGMRLPQILYLTRSLGSRGTATDGDPAVDVFKWTDASGAAVEVELRHGRCRRWKLERPAADGADEQAPPQTTAGTGDSVRQPIA